MFPHDSLNLLYGISSNIPFPKHLHPLSCTSCALALLRSSREFNLVFLGSLTPDENRADDTIRIFPTFPYSQQFNKSHSEQNQQSSHPTAHPSQGLIVWPGGAGSCAALQGSVTPCVPVPRQAQSILWVRLLSAGFSSHITI